MIHHNDLIGKKVYRSFDSKTFVCCSLSLNPFNHKLSLVLVDHEKFKKDMLNCFELHELRDLPLMIEWDSFMENYKFSEYRDYSKSELDLNHTVLQINWQKIKKHFLELLVPLIPEKFQKNTPKDHP